MPMLLHYAMMLIGLLPASVIQLLAPLLALLGINIA